jgi:putative CocE/NonD family hydrolase
MQLRSGPPHPDVWVQRPISDVRLLHDQKVPMRDGISLSADVFLPRKFGRYPTILSRTPYDSLNATFMERAVWWAQRGYAVVIQDCRGRFESGGFFRAFAQEPNDGYDTLEWLGYQRWSSGKVGMWGRSYGALTQWQVAPQKPPNLACLAPHVVPDDYFGEYHYVDGAFQLALAICAAAIWSTSNSLLETGSAELFNNQNVYRHLPLVELDVVVIGREIAFWRDWLAHETNDEFWKRLSTVDNKNEIEVPCLQQSGWFDPYVRSAFRGYNSITAAGASELARANQRVIVGPWTHEEPQGSTLGQLDFGKAADMQLREEELRWFDKWLRDEESGFDDSAPIRIFTMGTNRWRYEQEWPLARAAYIDYYLHSGGRSNTLGGDGRLGLEPPSDELPDRFTYDPEEPVPTVGGVHSIQEMTRRAEVPILAGPIDQRSIERREDVLVYTSNELEEDLEVTGPIELILFAASSGPDTDFTAKLVDVWPDGRAMSVTEGILRGRYRHRDDKPEALQSGELDEFKIRLYPTSQVFLRKHRIRIDISSSNFPRFSRNLNTGESIATATRIATARQTVAHSSRYPSRLHLPIVPGDS